jgi:mono/diheme cytochrome c family protein
MKNTRNILRFVALIILAVVAVSCKRDPNHPGIQFAPEMVEAIPYEPFRQVKDSVSPFSDGRNMQLPPEGTIPRGGHAAFAFGPGDSVKNSDAVKALPNPVAVTEKSMAEGQVLYDRFCGLCHGAKGKGDGPVAAHDAINPSPYDSEKLRAYTPGQLYHTIVYGQGVMGSYASQLDHDERWKVVHYVQTLQGNNVESAPVDSAAVIGGPAAVPNGGANTPVIKGH